MNIIEDIKAFFKVKSLVTDAIKGATMPSASGKPGWKTSEFWGKIAIQVLTLWSAVKGFVPANTALIITTSLEAIYAIARTVSKAVSDIQSVQSGTKLSSTPPAN